MTYPLEIIRSRLAYQIRHQAAPVHRHHHHARHLLATEGVGAALHAHHQQYGILPTIRLIVRENEGSKIRGFYKGFGATMWGIVPYAG